MNNSKLDLILKKLGTIENEQLETKNELREIKSEQSEIRSEQLETKNEIREIKNEQKKIKSDVSEIKQTQTHMLQRFDDIEKLSDSIIEQVLKNSEDITVIKDNQQIIVDIVKRQEDTINVLARRSIDHEAEINRIK